MVLTAALGSVLGSALLGGAAAGAGSFLGSRSSAKASESIADRQNEYNERMYGQRHQMEVADLRKAGLNPILSAGASPPSPAAAAAQVAPDYSRVAGDAIAGMSASNARKQARAQYDLTRVQQRATHAQAEQAQSQVEKNRADALKSSIEASLKAEELGVYESDREAYKSKLLDAPYAREAKSLFTNAKAAADKFVGGTTSVFTDLNNARKAAAAANRRQREVDERYPNRKESR